MSRPRSTEQPRLHADSTASALAAAERARILGRESAWLRSLAYCTCRRPILAATYLGRQACRCGRVLDCRSRVDRREASATDRRLRPGRDARQDRRRHGDRRAAP